MTKKRMREKKKKILTDNQIERESSSNRTTSLLGLNPTKSLFMLKVIWQVRSHKEAVRNRVENLVKLNVTEKSITNLQYFFMKSTGGLKNKKATLSASNAL